MCSGHTAVTLLLSAAAAEAGDSPEKAERRATLSSQAPLCCWPPAQLGGAADWQGQRPHLLPPPRHPRPPEQGRVPPPETVCIQLFWSVGDLFTCRSRFLLPTTRLCRRRGSEARCVPGSWSPASCWGWGVPGMPGACLTIYRMPTLVCLRKRERTILEKCIIEMSASGSLRVCGLWPSSQGSDYCGLSQPAGRGA